YDRITAEDLKQFYKKYYTFNQCYVILAGNAGKDTLECLESTLGHSQWNSDTAVLTHSDIQIDTSAKHHRIISDAKDAVQSSIVIGRLLPAIKHEDFIPLTVLNCLLGGYFNSRLMTNIREDKGYTYGIDSYIAPFSKASVFMIASDVTADKDNLTIEEIKKEIEILQTEPVSTEELDTVKHYIIGDMLRSNDGVYDISETYDQMIRFDLPDNYNSWSMQKVKQVSQKDITDTAKKYLNTEQMVVSVAKNMNK
ncbi:MAG: insulinase family protein, partial [Bacteroidales bacterium]|nr:insulinase family protein [Bacteroidales bacterium]